MAFEGWSKGIQEGRQRENGMTLTEIIAEMKSAGRQPDIVVSAHEKTLDAIVALAQRLDKLEKRK